MIMRSVVPTVKIPMMNSLTNFLSLMKMKTFVFARYIWRQRFKLGSLNLIIVSCVTKVELDMPVVTAHISYMYWGLCIGMRHGKREESCGKIGEREDSSSGKLEDSGHVYSRG